MLGAPGFRKRMRNEMFRDHIFFDVAGLAVKRIPTTPPKPKTKDKATQTIGEVFIIIQKPVK